MEKELFEQLVMQLCNEDSNITPGPMMSSLGIRYRGKVFAFLSKNDEMVFKLGKDFNTEEFEGITPFNPFKNKGPLPGWYAVPYSLKDLWKPFSNQALNLMIK